MASYLQSPLLFLIESLLGLYLTALLLRLLCQLVGVSYYNPLVQFIARITRPAILPFLPLLPRIGRFDLATFAALILVALLKHLILLWLQGGTVSLGAATAIGLLDIANLLFAIYIYGILAYALLSWFPIGYGHPLVQLLEELFDPILDRFRQIVPPIGGIDLSPLIALIALEALRRFTLPLLQEIAYRLLVP